MERPLNINKIKTSIVTLIVLVFTFVGCKNHDFTNKGIFNKFSKDDSLVLNNKATGLFNKESILIEKNIASKSKINTSDYSIPYSIDISKIDQSGYLKQLLFNFFLKSPHYKNLSFIKSISKVWSGKLFGIGNCRIYKLDFTDDVAMAYEKHTFIIVNLEKSIFYSNPVLNKI